MDIRNLGKMIAIISAVVLILARVSLGYVLENRENLEILRNIEGSLNHAIEPCDDFYEYACGNFGNQYNKSVYDDLDYLALMNFQSAIVKIIGQEHVTQKQNQSVMDKASSFYHSCENLYGKWEIMRYLDELKPASGLEWPLVMEMLEGETVISTWNSQQFDVLDFVAQLNSYGVRNIFLNYEFHIVDNMAVITLWASDLEELKPQAVEDILKDFGFPSETLIKYRDEILQVHAHWESTYKTYNEQGEQQILPYRKVKESFPKLATFLEKSIQGDVLKGEYTLLSIFEVNFINFLMSKQWQPAEKRKFCNYLMVRYLQHIKKNHKRSCATDLSTKMGLAVNYMYYERHYQPEAQEFNAQISQVIAQVRNIYLQILNENHMNFNKTQMNNIKTTMREISVNIGNLPVGVNAAVVEEFYSTIPSIYTNNFYKNDLLMLRQQEYEKVKCKQVNSWSCSRDYTSFPFNTPQLNTVFVPFASINLPVYHYKLDPLFALSSIGFFFGHEFTHSIEAESLILSGDPLFENVTENPAYRNTHDCLMQQYPTENMLERVADLVGLRVAYRAYTRAYGKQPNFTNIPWQQLFFVNLAQPFCTNGPDLAIEHDTGKIRLREIAMNSAEYAEAFQCPKGSKMNPVNKCRTYI